MSEANAVGQPATQPRPIPIRRVDLGFDADPTPNDYYRGDPHLTAVLNALSTFFPDGERFFVEAVRHYRDRITDPKLAADIAAFIGQEAMHAKQHEQFNSLNEQNGLASAKLGDRIARGLLGRARRLLPPRARLGITCALEHYTAILAEQMLTNDAHRESLRGRARELWLWHALEETEHKAVAFDVYQAIGGTYGMRVRTMIPASVFFIAATIVVYFAMTADRGVLYDVRGHMRVFDYLWLRPGLFRSLIGPYLEYYRRDFHPNDRDTRGLVEQWNEALFGDAGALRDRLFRKKPPATA